MDTTPYGDEAYEVQMGRKKEKNIEERIQIQY
jgi:hypothetical protein